MSARQTYALLIYRPEAGAADEVGAQKALKGHRKLQKEAAASKDLHAVARLDDVATAKTVRVNGSAHDVTDGPFIETKEWLVGLYMLDCRNMDEAVERARLLCPLDDHVIEVRPVTWRWKP